MAVVGNIRISGLFIICHAQGLSLSKYRMLLPEADAFFHKGKHFLCVTALFPGDPSRSVILTPCVVIASLTVQDFIAGINHRRTLSRHDQKKRVSELLPAQNSHRLFSAWSFLSAVPGVIAIKPVPVVLPVFLIVLFSVGNHIRHGKSILIRHEIQVPAPAVISAQKAGDLLRRTVRISFQKTPHGLLKTQVINTQIPELRLFRAKLPDRSREIRI